MGQRKNVDLQVLRRKPGERILSRKNMEDQHQVHQKDQLESGSPNPSLPGYQYLKDRGYLPLVSPGKEYDWVDVHDNLGHERMSPREEMKCGLQSQTRLGLKCQTPV